MNRIRRTLVLVAVLSGTMGIARAGSLRAAPDRPNIVLIMTDNHGAWTLGCYRCNFAVK